MLHGWMDVAASFQFVVDALADERHVIALDWRGFGATDTPAGDTYFFHEYLGDLETVLDALFGAGRGPLDLLGHSMGGNVAMLYSGVRPDKVRRLVNLEGFGMPRSRPEQAPKRLAFWLAGLKQPETLRPTTRSRRWRARLQEDQPAAARRPRPLAGRPLVEARSRRERRARHLAPARRSRTTSARARSSPTSTNGSRRTSGSPRRCCGSRATAPTSASGGATATAKAEFHERLNVVKDVERHVVRPAGHMLHPRPAEDVARLVESFLA
jgi:pimeloyl-ACP methyl ester carboxylesterase